MGAVVVLHPRQFNDCVAKIKKIFKILWTMCIFVKSMIATYRKKLTPEVIEKVVNDIKSKGYSKPIEDIKIRDITFSYYSDTADKYRLGPAIRFTRNLEYLMNQRNMKFSDLGYEVEKKTGIPYVLFFSSECINPDRYALNTLFQYTVIIGFTFNICPWDLLQHDIEYQIGRAHV